MTLDLAEDVRRRVRRQARAIATVEAVDRLDQSDAADLRQVVELLAAARVALGKAAHEADVALDQLLACVDVAALVEVAQELRIRGRPVARRARCMRSLHEDANRQTAASRRARFQLPNAEKTSLRVGSESLPVACCW